MKALFEYILGQLDRMITDVRYLMAQQPGPQLNRAHIALVICRRAVRALVAEEKARGGQE